MPIHAGYHSRGYLPHIKVPGAAYFVTFRLADSLPHEVIARLRDRREDLLARALQASSDEARTTRDLFAWYASEVDAALDQHVGAAWLRDPAIAQLVVSALRYFDGERYRLHAWCVMPNHVHVVVRPTASHSLDAILQSWKSFTAHHANKVLGRSGQFWQRESYDHWIRDDADFAHCCRYTEENPVNAQLCSSPSEWPWSSASQK